MGILDALNFGPKITYPPEKPAGEPPMYGGSNEDWASYRRQQEMTHNNAGLSPQAMESAAMLDMLAKSIGGGRGTVNPDSVDPFVSMQPEQGGSGRGVVNPASVVPGDPAENGILGAAFPEVFRRGSLKPTYLNMDNTISNDQTSPLKQGDGRKETYFADTTGGVDRVNARTKEHGVTAIERDGKTYMTNINADGSVNKGTGSPNSVGGNGMGSAQSPVAPGSQSIPNISGDISASIDKLKKTNDFAEARGLIGNLVTSLASSKALMEQDAIKLAAVKFGLPQLEAELQKSIQADMADPKWYPGIGDSPITAKLRAEIGQANINSRQYAGTYLSSNTSYASLGAYEKMANMEYDRIKTATERTDRLSDASAETLARNKLNRIAMAEEEISALPAAALQRMMILNPALGVKDADGKLDPIAIAKTMKDGNTKEAVMADPNTLVVLAMERNPAAQALVTRMESGIMKESEVGAKLQDLVKMANSSEFLKTYAEFKFPGKKPDQDAYIADRSSKKLSTDKAGKEEARRQMLMEALEIERSRQTGYALANITTILPADGIYAKAIADARKVTGNTSLENVALALMKDSTSSQDAYIKKMMLSQDIQAALRKRPPSVFGAPDGNQMQAALIHLTRTPWQATKDILNTQVSIPPFAPILGFASGMAQQYMNEK